MMSRRDQLKLAVSLSLGVICTAVLAKPSFCNQSELVLWSCSAGQKHYAVCASGDLSDSAGYLQYRVKKNASLEFVYPTKLKHPKDLFLLEILNRGASLTFQNGAYQYTIYEPLMGPATVSVAKNEQTLTTIICSTATDGLTLTTTQEFLSRVGVYKRSGQK
jgi:hypothetical protein